MTACSSCGTENAEGVAFCKGCGRRLEPADDRPVCHSCSKVNPANASFCWNCGAYLWSVSPVPGPPAAPRENLADGRPCPSCGRRVEASSVTCPACGFNLVWKEPALPTTEGGRMSTWLNVAGILLILSGIAAFYTSYQMFEAQVIVLELTGYEVSSFGCCGVLEIVFGVGAIVGGYFATKQRRFLFALIGSILGLLSIGPLYLGSIAALVGLVLVAVYQKGFED